MNIITGTEKQYGRKDSRRLVKAIVGVLTNGNYTWRGKYDASVTYNPNDAVLVMVNGLPKLMYALGVTSGTFDATRWNELVITMKNTDDSVTVVNEEITIPATGWTKDDVDDNGYDYYIDVPSTNASSQLTPLLTIHPTSMAVAEACEMTPSCQTMDGMLRVYANHIPSGGIEATLSLFGVSSNTLELAIPTEGWVADGIDDNGYEYYLDIANEKIKATQTPILSIHPESLDTAAEADINGACETFDGYIRLYTNVIPTKVIYATLSLFGSSTLSSGSGSSYVLPVATATTLGGIKLGAGLTASTDGTVRVDVDDAVIAEELKDTISTDEDADAAIDDAMSGKTSEKTEEEAPTSEAKASNVASDSEVDSMLDGIFS